VHCSQSHRVRETILTAAKEVSMSGKEQNLSPVVETSAGLSTSNVNAVFAGLMKIEALNCLEQAVFAKKFSEIFLQPSPELVDAYKFLS
jgi:hypothetical protein